MENIVLDTNVFIRVIERQRGWEESERILQLVEGGKIKAVISTIVLAELSVGYHKTGKLSEKESFFVRLAGAPSYEIVTVDMTIADHAGKIRAETGLSLPDAIIVATALEYGAKAIITDDGEFRRVKRLIQVLSAREYR